MGYIQSHRRIVLWVCASLLMLFVTIAVTFRIHLYILRHRAQRLLTDMQSITLRRTTFREVEPIFARWQRWGKFDGPCSAVHCTFDISLSDITHVNHFLYSHDTLFDLASYFGERPTVIRAELTVLNDLVWSEGIVFGVEHRVHSDGKSYIEMVSGEATSVSRLVGPDSFGFHWHLHPDFAIRAPDNLTNQFHLHFTPFANFADIHHLMTLNFSCLTRIVPCADKKDIMPAAIAEVEYWSSLPDDPADYISPHWCDDPLRLELDARDSADILVARVSERQPVFQQTGKLYERPLIVQEYLKVKRPTAGQAPSRLVVWEVPESGVKFRQGSLVILFYKDGSFDSYSLTGCSPLSVTPPHLAAVRRGIADDTRPVGLPDYAFQPVSTER